MAVVFDVFFFSWCVLFFFTFVNVQAPDPSKNVAGMYTPFSKIPGDGERYYLTTALALQRAGYFVVLLVDDYSSCQKIECIKKNAESLRIELLYAQLSIKTIQVESYHTINKYYDKRRYDAFILYDNKIIPNIYAIGKHMNLYIVHHPFSNTYHTKITENAAAIKFSEYDYVMVNSIYTYGQYAKVIQPAYELIYNNHLIGPTVKIIYAPIQPLVSHSHSSSTPSSSTDSLPLVFFNSSTSSSSHDVVMNIIMNISQYENQQYGLRVFNHLIHSTNSSLHLYLLDSSSSSTSSSSSVSYLSDSSHSLSLKLNNDNNDDMDMMAELKKYAEDKQLPVTFLNNISSLAHIVQVLPAENPTIYWQFSGFQQLQHDKHNHNTTSINTNGFSTSNHHRKAWYSNNNHHQNPLQQLQSKGTGNNNNDDVLFNKKNEEYRGIAVIEAMAVGCIPIVMNAGGTNDTIKDGMNGYLVETVRGFIENTLSILFMPLTNQKHLQSAAIETSKKYQAENFIRSFHVMINRGGNAKIFTKIVKEYIGVIRTIHLPHLPFHSYEKVAVIIEPDIHAHFEFCVRNIIHYLDRSWSIQVHHSHDNEAYVKSVLHNIPFIQYRLLPMRVTSAKEYNILMKSIPFWESLETQKVLIFQSDSVLLNYGINKYIQYDYIGAPWDVKNNDQLRSLVKGAIGNGGFSIRSVDMMIKILKTFGNSNSNSNNSSYVNDNIIDSPPNNNSNSNNNNNNNKMLLSSSSALLDQEDLFFVYYCEQLGAAICKLASPQEAYLFALEVPIQSLNRQKRQMGTLFPLPPITFYDHLSLHAAWHYIPPQVTKQLLTNMMKAMLISFPND